MLPLQTSSNSARATRQVGNRPLLWGQRSVLFSPMQLLQKSLTGQLNGGITFFLTVLELTPLWQNNRVLVARKQETEGLGTRQPWVYPPLLTYSQLATPDASFTSPVSSAGDKHMPYRAAGTAHDVDWVMGENSEDQLWNACTLPVTAWTRAAATENSRQFLRRLNIISVSNQRTENMSTGEHAGARECLRHHCTKEPRSRNKSDDYHQTTKQRHAVHAQQGRSRGAAKACSKGVQYTRSKGMQYMHSKDVQYTRSRGAAKACSTSAAKVYNICTVKMQ